MWDLYPRIYGGGASGRDLRDLRSINHFRLGMVALGEGLPENPESTGL
jgi:hypothetical protein